MTNLIEFQGYTKEEARKIMARKLVDDVTRNHPVIRQLMGVTLAKEMGLGEEVAQMLQPEGGTNPTPQFGSEGGEPREANIKTSMGREMVDMSAERRPPRMQART